MKKFKKHIFSFLILLIICSSQFLITSNSAILLANDSAVMEIQDPFKEATDIAYGSSSEPLDVRIMVVRIINVFLTLLATIFFVLIVIAGFQWLTAGGSPEKTKAAMGRIKNAIIGLIIVTISWSISFFILQRLIAISQGHPTYIYTP